MAANQPEKIAFDSTVVISLLRKEENRYEWIKPRIADAEAGRIGIIASPWAVVEAYKINGVNPDDDLAIIEEFYDRPYVDVHSMTSAVAKIARGLRRDYGIDAIDSVHIATAVASESLVFLTNDGEGNRNKTPLLPLDNTILVGREKLRIYTPKDYELCKARGEAPLTAPAFENKSSPESPPMA